MDDPWTVRARSSAADCDAPTTHAGGELTRRRVLTSLSATALIAATGSQPGSVIAQETSSRPIRLMVPFAPGAAVDVVARMLANGLAARLGRAVIVENRPGGGTLIAAEAVARSRPDGDTLFFGLDNTFTVVPLITKNVSFDPNKELVPINIVGTIARVLIVTPSLGLDSLRALIDYARANPTALSYGSSGAGSGPQLAMEMLKAHTNINILHVPYRGLAPALMAVISGEVQVAIVGVGDARGTIETGRVRALAIISPGRVPTLPNVSTIRELGYEQAEAASHLIVAAPAGTSDQVIERLNDAISHVLTGTDTRKQIEGHDVVVTNMGQKALAEELKRLSRVNAEAVRIAGVQPE